MAGAARAVHLFTALAGFSVLLFFSVTGIALNHPEWFGKPVLRTKIETGQVELPWLGTAAVDDRAATEATATEPKTDDRSIADRETDETKASEVASATSAKDVDRLAIAEYLRATHRLRGEVRSFDVADDQVGLTFLAPGYAATATIVRATGRYEVAIDRHDFVSLMNDLHRGREAGTAWHLVIDVAAGLLVFTSLTGVWLLVHVKKQRAAGVITLLAGIIALLAAVGFAVP